jgi:ribonuclease MRP protein subunit SNM1
MDPATAARLRYLNDSAHLLAYSAPSTAAFLQSRYNKVLEDEGESVPDARNREICGACGFNMLWNPIYLPAKLEPESKKQKKRQQKAHDATDEVKKRVLLCRMCHSKTQFNLPIARRTRRAAKFNISLPAAAPSTPAAAILNPPGKASSERGGSTRKRAKGRKQQSLQAMLAKSKAEAAAMQPGFGLDLMDLMKGT